MIEWVAEAAETDELGEALHALDTARIEDVQRRHEFASMLA